MNKLEVLQIEYQYKMMIPPFEMDEYSKLTKQQAQEYFDWFTTQIPERIEILLGAIESSGEQNLEQFDMTPESLKPLWSWLKKNIKTTPKSQAEMNELKTTLPNRIFEDVNDWKLDSSTLVLAMDVSLYFAEVFLKNYSNLYWNILSKPKSHVDLNKPVIIGFKNAPLYPPRIIRNLCSCYAEGDSSKSLLSLYEVWKSFIKI